VLLAPFLPSVETDAPVRDAGDAPVISSAVTAHAEAIVTGDPDLLEQGPLRDWLDEREILVLTAAELLARIGR
jgi:predicted nucleic acid-binding protein